MIASSSGSGTWTLMAAEGSPQAGGLGREPLAAAQPRLYGPARAAGEQLALAGVDLLPLGLESRPQQTPPITKCHELHPMVTAAGPVSQIAHHAR